METESVKRADKRAASLTAEIKQIDGGPPVQKKTTSRKPAS